MFGSKKRETNSASNAASALTAHLCTICRLRREKKATHKGSKSINCRAPSCVPNSILITQSVVFHTHTRWIQEIICWWCFLFFSFFFFFVFYATQIGNACKILLTCFSSDCCFDSSPHNRTCNDGITCTSVIHWGREGQNQNPMGGSTQSHICSLPMTRVCM